MRAMDRECNPRGNPAHARAIQFFIAAFTGRYVLRTKAYTVYFPRVRNKNWKRGFCGNFAAIFAGTRSNEFKESNIARGRPVENYGSQRRRDVPLFFHTLLISYVNNAKDRSETSVHNLRGRASTR